MTLLWFSQQTSDGDISQLLSDGTMEVCCTNMFLARDRTKWKWRAHHYSSEMEHRGGGAAALLDTLQDKLPVVPLGCLVLHRQGGIQEPCWNGCHCPALSGCAHLPRSLPWSSTRSCFPGGLREELSKVPKVSIKVTKAHPCGA